MAAKFIPRLPFRVTNITIEHPAGFSGHIDVESSLRSALGYFGEGADIEVDVAATMASNPGYHLAISENVVKFKVRGEDAPLFITIHVHVSPKELTNAAD